MQTTPLWPDSTIVCMASGPSLNAADVELCRGQHVIAVNDAIKLCPWAEVLNANDVKWWGWNPDYAADERLLKFTISIPAARRYPLLQRLEKSGWKGIDFRPGYVRTGGHSGYTAINVAVHLGARRIILIGYDMQPLNGQHHFFGNHPDRSHLAYGGRLPAYRTLLPDLEPKGITLINASRRTSIPSIPRESLENLLAV